MFDEDFEDSMQLLHCLLASCIMQSFQIFVTQFSICKEEWQWSAFTILFLTSLITNLIGLRLSLQVSPEFKILSSAGISKISHNMTISLATMFDKWMYPDSIIHTQIIFLFSTFSC